MRVFALLSLAVLSLLTQNLSAIAAQSDSIDGFTGRFGYPLYQMQEDEDIFNAGLSYRLYSSELATLNIENSGDLLQRDHYLFHADKVTAGRQVFLSSFGFGPETTRLQWRGRPMRDPWTGLADFSLLPPGFIGDVRSSAFGALGGSTSPGVQVDFQPLLVKSREPITSIHHRDGYYDFAPVEFIHARGINENLYFIGGGFFPSSAGRWEHAEYDGELLSAELIREFPNDQELTISYMLGKHRNEIPFSDTIRTVKRRDFDINYSFQSDEKTSSNLGFYHVEHRNIYSGLGASNRGLGARENGFHLRSTRGRFGVNLRVAGLAGDTDSGERFNLTDLEATGVLKGRSSFADYTLQLGGVGWMPNQVKPLALLALNKRVGSIGQLSLSLKQVSRVPSPMEQFGDHANSELDMPPEDYEVGVDLNERVSAQTFRSIAISLERQFVYGKAVLTGYGILVEDPVLWRITADSTIIRHQFDQMQSIGWEGSWDHQTGPYRASLKLSSFSRSGADLETGDYYSPEPPFRISWETGWHRLFWDESFEADIMFSGRYLQSYFAYDESGWQEIGGAYPLDFRMTFRISNFNFYWGLHNWNAYPYSVVPGYRMMHKEEYWGINWLLIG